jgi:hypothetical protein
MKWFSCLKKRARCGKMEYYMSLYEKLKTAKSEEDVKDAYIKAIGLKDVNKGLIDIRTDRVWFEAKDKGSTTTYEMFTQLLYYIKVTRDRGETTYFVCY